MPADGKDSFGFFDLPSFTSPLGALVVLPLDFFVVSRLVVPLLAVVLWCLFQIFYH